MADYSKTTNFTAKDSLSTGDPNKVIKGSEHDTEFDNIATASATKANKIASAVVGNLIKQSSTGDLVDSGYGSSSLSKAWASVTGTGTVTIKDSLNVSSVTDLGVGLYQINFTTNMNDANYGVFPSNTDLTSQAHYSTAAVDSVVVLIYGDVLNDYVDDTFSVAILAN